MSVSRPPFASFRTAALLPVAAALLFGAGTPLTKLLLVQLPPQLLAGLMYVGAGAGLLGWRFFSARSRRGAKVRRSESVLGGRQALCLTGAVLAGGTAAPVMLFLGLRELPAANASLLLNLEVVFTALLARSLFREALGRRAVAGMAAILAGSLLLAGAPFDSQGLAQGAGFVVGACFLWAVDNNLTREVAAGDPATVAGIKGLAAGGLNLLIAAARGSHFPSVGLAAQAALVGLVTIGFSLVLFVLALRQLGTSRTGNLFAVAPFAGALLSVLLLGDSPTGTLVGAGCLMLLGIWITATERHGHGHVHPVLRHHHVHSHDDDHGHPHFAAGGGPGAHSHLHEHASRVHAHDHYPDIHHRHRHT